MTGDPLTDVLLQRAMGGAQQQVPVTPPSPTRRVPTKVQRFANAQQIQDAYRNGWAPNPVLLQAQLGK